MRADTQTEAAVKSMLNKFSETYTKRDLDGLVALFVPDSDVVVIGTGADEKRVGIDEVIVQAKRDWGQSDAASIEFEWSLVSAAGPVAWVATEASVRLKAGEQEMSLPARLTAVLERRGDKWLFAQAHLSFPAAGQVEGESFPT